MRCLRGDFEQRRAAGSNAFLCAVADEYEAALAADESRAAAPGVSELRRLLRGREADGSKERCWNWRGGRLAIGATMRARGDEYNGYPNSAGYFGSYCLDGLAMALHSVAETSSFDAAVAHCVNLLGDADSTGAIAGQIAGAMYGFTSINPIFVEWLSQWDDGHVGLRAALLATHPRRDEEVGDGGAGGTGGDGGKRGEGDGDGKDGGAESGGEHR